jgi:hypothetical protein
MPNTRAQIRQEIGARLQELYQGVITSGSATAITDANLADAGADRDHEGAWVMMGGANTGVVRRVVAYDRGTGTLTLHSALPALPSQGDAFELHSMVNPEDINRAINWTLRRMTYMTDVSHTASVGGDTLVLNNDPYVTQTSQIVDVLVPQDSATPWDQQLQSVRWWRARGAGGVVYITLGNSVAAGDQFVIRAQLPYNELTGDAYETPAPLGWLIPGALAEVYTLMSRKAPAQDAERFEKTALKEAANFTAASMTFAPRPPRKIAQHGYPGARRGMTESGV